MKVIQVGIGGMGQAWLRAVQQSDEVTFAGFVEINDEVAEQVAASFGLDRTLIFKSLPEALDAVQADGVIDVTPPRFHREISLTALEAGIPVLSEKPLADTLEAARDIVRKADETGVLHMVAQNYRYSVPAQTLKQELASGVFGAVGSVTVEFFKGPHFGGFREEMPYPLVIDMAIHHFDMLRFLLGRDPVAVYGHSWNPSWSWFQGDASAAAVFQFEDGVTASYNGSWCSQGQETPWNGHWRFECENGVVTLRNDVVRVAGLDNPVPPVEMVHTAQSYLLHEFYQAVSSGTPPATTCQDNIHSLAMVFALVQSFETGTEVRI